VAFVAVSGAAAAESTLGTDGGRSARLATMSDITSTVLPIWWQGWRRYLRKSAAGTAGLECLRGECSAITNSL
jgi:hypothetical protein